MFVGTTFIYLMMPKTGCMDTMERLKIADPDGKFKRVPPEGKHNGIWCVDAAEYAGKHILGGIRNPLAWYLSHWAHFCYKNKRGRYWRYLCDNDPRILPLLEDSTKVDNFREWLRIILDPDGKFDPVFNKRTYSKHVGWMTHYYARMYLKGYPKLNTVKDICNEENKVTFWIHTEYITVDILDYFSSVSTSTSLTEEIMKKIIGLPKHNTTKHALVEEAYTDELIQMVKKREWFIFRKFKYE